MATKNKLAAVILGAFLVFFLGSVSVFAHDDSTEGVVVPKVTTGTASRIDAVNDAVVGALGSRDATGAVRAVRTSSATLKNALAARKSAMEALAVENPVSFLDHVFSPEVRKALPIEVQSELETETTVTGTISLVHVDDFKDTSKSKFLYQLITDSGETLQLYPSVEGKTLSTGTRVAVSGYRIGDVVVTKRTPTALTVSRVATPKVESLGVQRTLVIPIKYAGDSKAYPGPGELAKRVFNGGFEHFFEEQSYGKASFKGKVTDWVTITSESFQGGCATYVNERTPEVRALLESQSISLANYDRLVFLAGGGFGGCSNIGKSDNTDLAGNKYRLSLSWIGLNMDFSFQDLGKPFSWNEFDFVLSHELGHALGLAHANSWYCGAADPLYGSCRHNEYGNYFDTMGHGLYGLHFTAFYKYLLGWLTLDKNFVVTKNQTITLKPLESGDTGVFALVQNPALSDASSNSYSLEFRQLTGFDRTASTSYNPPADGVFVNWIIGYKDPNWYVPLTRLINTNPSTWDKGVFTPMLLPGRTLADAGRGITFKTLSIQDIAGVIPTTRAASVKITFSAPQCKRFAPSIAPDYYVNESRAGDPVYVTAQVVNTNYPGCSPSTYSLTLEGPSGWSPLYYGATGSAGPSQSAYLTGSLQVPLDTAKGEYAYTVKVSDENGLVATSQITVGIIPALHIDAMRPASGAVGTTIKLTGIGFSPYTYRNPITIIGPGGDIKAETIFASSQDGKTLSFSFPSQFYNTNDWSPIASTTYGTYKVFVGNSNTVTFKLKKSVSLLLNSSLASAYAALRSVWESLWGS